jgi:uncharacterized protein YoxC
MIKINLLPLDKRKTERTPLKGAGLMVADAIVIAVVAILIVIHWIQIGNLDTEIKAKKETLASLQKDVKVHDDLLAKSQRLQAEFNDLQKITATRPFKWSEVVDAVWDAVNKHKRVWLDSIEQMDGKQVESKMKALDGKTPVTGVKYGILLKCHVAGIDVRSITAFRQELKESPRVARFFPGMNFDMQWNLMEQKEFTEKYSLDFEIMLINTGQSTANTPEPATARSSP